MTIVSLFFYRDLMNMEPDHKSDVGTESDTDNDMVETPHYENDPVWDSEDDYRE